MDLRVAIVGCGKIADQHAGAIKRLSGYEIIAACDRDPLMAAQFSERFRVPQTFSDLDALLKRSRPDVVHITTPPHSHLDIGLACLNNGCHIYVEKPFTLRTSQAEQLIDRAIERKLKLTVGHNMQFSHAAQRMRRVVADGWLGGAPVHIESYYCYDLNNPYGHALLADSEHWLRRMPGRLLQNIISHGLAKVAEFLPDDHPDVHAFGWTSPALEGMGEAGILDELRVVIRGRSTSAYFTFSATMKPTLHQIRLFGRENALVVDDDQQCVLRLAGRRRKSYLEPFVTPWEFASQYAANSLSNIKRFVRADFHQSHSMYELIGAFCESIVEDRPPPIPYREILLAGRMMDEIFRQVATVPAEGSSLAAPETFPGR